ncbi:type II toxin-antitoxin system RelE/ParE family toxin, partial [Microcystis aeruginosa]
INPRNHPNIKSLKGELSGYYRYRVGDYRVKKAEASNTNLFT